MNSLIDALHNKNLIWQGSKHTNSIANNTIKNELITTGYKELDHQLGGGFPPYGVVEITSNFSIGELRLLTPYIKNTAQEKLAVFINMPGYLCAEYWQYQGVDLSHVIMLFPKTEKEALWSAEQCLKSGSCGSVMLWHPSLEVHQARRLQVASETGQCLHFLFKTKQKHQISLPISLNMRLQAQASGLKVSLNKRKGGWLKSTFFIDMAPSWPYCTPKNNNSTQHQYKHNNIVRFPPLKRGQA